MYPARTIAKISEATRAAFKRFVPKTDSAIIQNFLYATRKTLALVLKEVDLRAQYIYDQIFTTSADEFHLEHRHAAEFGMVKNAPGFASGLIVVNAFNAGSFPKGIRWVSGGVTYFSTDAVTVASSGTFSMPVRALVSGISANRVEDDNMALADPGSYPSLDPVANVSSGEVSGGTEKEDIESLRERVLERKRNPPQGGNEPDYVRFGKDDLAFVSKAWARRPVGGPGALAIWFLNKQNEVPSQSEIDQYSDHLHERRLLGLRDLQVYALVDEPPTIQIKLSPDTEELRVRVRTSIDQMLLSRSRPGLPPKRPGQADDDFVLSHSWVSEAVSTVVGEDSHELVLPVGDLTYTIGKMPLTANVSFV